MDHFHQNIPGFFDFDDVYRAAVRRAEDGAVFVEVGSWKGRSAAFMAVEILNSGKAITFDCVDIWETLGWTNVTRAKDPLATIDEFLRNVAPAHAAISNCHVMQSTEAARLYDDASVDFVFLDADHSYEAVAADIAAWWPKVKSGGVLAGHDFAASWPGVQRAVREAFPAFGVSRFSWFVTKDG